MNPKTKPILLAFCIGIVAAVITDSLFPKYTYSYDGDELTKEAYLDLIKHETALGGFEKTKAFNIHAVLVGMAVTVGTIIFLSNKSKVNE